MIDAFIRTSFTMDIAATQWINGLSGHAAVLDAAMAALSTAGIPALIALTAIRWWSPSDRPAARHACLAAGLSFLGGLAVNQLVLLFVHRVRPYDAGITQLLIAPSADWSFPSDHATAAAAIVAALWLKGLRRYALLLVVPAALICFSRVFLGIHYVSDILGGALTGAFAAAAVCWMFRDTLWINRALVRIL
jgi:undecaprenyl-diphosphatase